MQDFNLETVKSFGDLQKQRKITKIEVNNFVKLRTTFTIKYAYTKGNSCQNKVAQVTVI